jgi:hypothetical protein
VSADIVFVDSYLCPQCRAELEAGPHGWRGWLRCPACGCPSLPPQPVMLRIGPRPKARPSRPPEVLFISESGSQIIQELPEDQSRAVSTHFSPARLVLTTGLALCLFMAFVAFLDNRTINTAIFGFLSIVFFVMLLRTSPRRHTSA